MKISTNVKYPILSPKQLEALLAAQAKGTVTKLADYTKKMIKHKLSVDLYAKKLVNTKHSAYKRTGYLMGSVTATRTESIEDSFYAEAMFDQDYLRSHSAPPTYGVTKKGTRKIVEFGRYTDIYGNYVGDEMIEGEWLEEGTEERSIVPRRGAHFLQHTEEEIDRFIDAHGIEGMVRSEMGNVVIERIR